MKLENAILKHSAMVALQQETIDAMVTKLHDIWENLLSHAGEISEADRRFLFDTITRAWSLCDLATGS